MKRSSALHPKPADALVALAIVLAAALAFFSCVRQADGGSLSAVISVNGTVTETVALSALAQPEERVFHANGYTLHLSLSGSGAEMAEADCPTQDCVRTGRITQPGQSIVCLPARVSVVLKGSGDGGVDAVLG